MTRICFVFLLLVTTGIVAEEPPIQPPDLSAKLKKDIASNPITNDQLKHFAINTLLAECHNSIFVEQVKLQNEKNISIEDIKITDKQWINSESTSDFKKELLETVCSTEIKRIATEHSEILEAFVMDNQGALVGLTNVTSDYWQGDEAKWKKSFRKGKGGVEIAAAKFDNSANAVLQQLSLPVIDSDGNVIGAITWGISLKRL